MFVAVVFPAEAHLSVLVGDQPLIGEGDPVGIAAEVLDGLLWAAEGRFGIGHPFGVAQGSQAGLEGGGFLQPFQIAEELEVALLERLLERFEEQAPEQTREHAHGEKEARAAGDPGLVIRGKAAAGERRSADGNSYGDNHFQSAGCPASAATPGTPPTSAPLCCQYRRAV